jgi:ankyrin repeat protein
MPSTSARFIPKTRLYLELSESPTPYDLKSKNLIKDLELAKRLINYEDLESKKQKVRKEYKQLTKKDIKRVEDEREDLLDLGMSFNQNHSMAKEFFYQVKKGDEAKIALIIKEFPEIVKEVDGTGQTALHWAARRRFINIVKGLLMCGVNPMAKDMVGRRAEDIARAKKFVDVSELLVAARRRTANVSKIFVSNDQRTNNPMALLMNMKVRRTINPLNRTVL